MSKEVIHKYVISPFKGIGYVGWVGLAVFGVGSFLLGLIIRNLTPDSFQLWLGSTPVGSMTGYALSFTVAAMFILLPFKWFKKLKITR